MSARLTTWHLSLGRRACLIATTTKRAAAEACGMSLYAFGQYASQTGNADDIALATSHPGVLFVHRLDGLGVQPWQQARHPHDDGEVQSLAPRSAYTARNDHHRSDL